MHNEKLQKTIIILLISCALAISLSLAGCLNHQNKWSAGGLGILLAQVEDGVVIKDIAPAFSNEDAALLKGDYIVKVDDIDVSNLPKEAILDTISGPVGGLVAITVLRKGQLVTIDIERIVQKDAHKKSLYSVTRTQTASLKTGNTKTELSATAAGNESKNNLSENDNADTDTDTDVSTEAEAAGDAAVLSDSATASDESTPTADAQVSTEDSAQSDSDTNAKPKITDTNGENQ